MRISLIMIIAMFGIFLTFALYGIVTFDLSIQEMKKLLGTRNEGFSFNMMQDLDQYIDKRLTDFTGITKLNVVQETIKESNEGFRKLTAVQALMQKNGTSEEIEPTPFLGEIDERFYEELNDTVQFYKDEYGYDVVEELFITNEYGANVALSSGTSIFRQDDQEWWIEAKTNGMYIGELNFNEKYGNHVTDLAFRVDDNDGNFLGVLRVFLTLDDMIHEFINDAEIVNLPTRNVVLLDNIGRVIYSQSIQNFTVAQPVPYFDRIQLGKDVGTIELTDDTEEVVMISYAKSTGYKTFPGFDWVILVDQTNSSFVEEFVELKNSILFVSIIGMISSIIIGVVVSFFITTPLKHLSNLANSIKNGKFDVKAKKSKINEIEVIGRSFNEMSGSLKKLIETEKQLAEAQARVKNERLSTIGEIAASMAHNMKNPLGTIQSSADIVKRNMKGGDKEIDDVLARMDRAIERMARQIEDVLNFVRVTPLNEQVVPLKEILDGATESITIPKNVSIDITPTDLKLKCDSRKIEIAFINLLLNAIQAIGTDQGKITVKARKEENMAIIEFEDSGPGIDETILPNLFEPLTTTKEKGTGLGLATCENIITQHGGTISVKNNPTVFTIRLPVNN